MMDIMMMEGRKKDRYFQEERVVFKYPNKKSHDETV
jgi:hypothetical protein